MSVHPKPVNTLEIRQARATVLVIDGARALDQIQVICQNYQLGSGRMIIQCYDQAWTGYWGSMSDRSIEQFFMDCDAEYLVGNLSSGRRRSAHVKAYLLRVVMAVQDALRLQIDRT